MRSSGQLAALSPREQGEVIALMPPSTRRGALKTLQPMRRREAAKSAQEAIAHKKESNGALSKGQHTVHREPRAREQTKRVVGKQCHMTTWQYVAMGVLLFVYVVVCVGFYLIELENSTELKVLGLHHIIMSQPCHHRLRSSQRRIRQDTVRSSETYFMN